MSRRWLELPLVAAVAFAAACGEDLAGGATCPSLCPEQSLPIEEVVLDAVTLDTTLTPYPIPGTEPGLLLASRSDSLDVRAVVRFDSLPKTFQVEGATDSIRGVDSARIRLRIDTAAVHFSGTITLEAYDVDTTAADTNLAALLPLYRANRLLGSVDIPRALLFLDDTVNVPIPNNVLLAKILAGQRLRVGFRFVGNGDLVLRSVETGLPAIVIFDPAPGNTTAGLRSVQPNSKTPSDDPIKAGDLIDFSVPVIVPPSPQERVTAGGLPASRAFLRLNIPRFYLDSVVLVRAQLLLTQRPIRGIDDADSTIVYPVAVSSTGVVTDLKRAAELVHPPLAFGITPLRFAPKDSGERSIDLVLLFRQWSLDAEREDAPQTAVVLRKLDEGRSAGRLAFYGRDAAPELRPRVRLSFVRRVRFGVP